MKAIASRYNLVRPLTPGAAGRLAGVSYRQIQYWDKTGLVRPLWIRKFRYYPFQTALFLVVIARLRKQKNSIQSVRTIMDSLSQAIEKIEFPLEESVILIGAKRFYISHGDVYASNEDLVRIDCRKLYERFAIFSQDLDCDPAESFLQASAVA